MLRVATVNVNGIRAAHRRGFGTWLAARDPDIVALQEVRCPVAALPDGAFGGYHAAYDPGRFAGRNGVAILTRMPPAAARAWDVSVQIGRPVRSGAGPDPSVEEPLGPGDATDADGGPGDATDADGGPGDADGGPRAAYTWEPRTVERDRALPRELRRFADHGRYLEVDLADLPLTVASLYLPKGGLPAHLQRPGSTREPPDGGHRFDRKVAFLRGFARGVTAARRAARGRGRDYLLMGDFNIAHGPLDVANWRRQVRVEGFLPEERAWMDEIVGPRRLVDVVRSVNPHVQGPYSWWSWLPGCFDRDTGWRIDLHLATAPLARAALAAGTDRAPDADSRMSDHAPVVVDYDVQRWLSDRASRGEG